MRDDFKVKQNRDLFMDLHQKKLRFDGRKDDEYRKIEYEFGKDPDTVMVSIGKTRVRASVAYEAVKPPVNKPREGHIIFRVTMAPTAHPSFSSGPDLVDKCTSLGRLLDRGLREAKAVDPNSLCILRGVLVWEVTVTVVVIDYDGNANDATSLAALAALMHSRRPDSAIKNGKPIIFPTSEKPPVPLGLHHLPISVSFFVFNGQAWMDGTHREEIEADGDLVFFVNPQKQICTAQKGSGPGLSLDVILASAEKSTDHALETIKELKRVIKQQSKMRDNEEVSVSAPPMMISLNDVVAEDDGDVEMNESIDAEAAECSGIFQEVPSAVEVPSMASLPDTPIKPPVKGMATEVPHEEAVPNPVATVKPETVSEPVVVTGLEDALKKKKKKVIKVKKVVKVIKKVKK